ncbi:MAG: MmgE/PrpD family protein [Armatimonadota bacterium]|nr:MmgE/PrpD family protein [Armatimonadota bacterium]
MSEAACTPEEHLAAFAVGLRSRDLPADVVGRARLVLVDTLGAIVGGMSRLGTSVAALAASAPGPAAVLGTRLRAEPAHAAMLHGTAGTALELDEGHRFAGGHPAIHVVPAALAAAEGVDATGEQLLDAVIAGYEVAARAGRSLGALRPPLHPHGTWGVLGGATAAALLLDGRPHVVVEALRIAAHYMLQTHYDSAIDGAGVRDTYAGVANMLGLVAARLAAAGVTGTAGVARALRPLAATEPDVEALTAGLGREYEIGRGYFKMHAACRHLHGALDCLDELARREPILPEDVVRVEVETYALAATFAHPRPGTRLAAKFSLPFAVATRLLHGSSWVEAFEPEALTARALALAERVHVRERPEFTALAPAQRPTRVTVVLRDGRRLEAQVALPRGEDHLAYSAEQVEEKFLRLVTPVLGARAGAALARWRQLGAQRVRALVQDLMLEEADVDRVRG